MSDIAGEGTAISDSVADGSDDTEEPVYEVWFGVGDVTAIVRSGILMEWLFEVFDSFFNFRAVADFIEGISRGVGDIEDVGCDVSVGIQEPEAAERGFKSGVKHDENKIY